MPVTDIQLKVIEITPDAITFQVGPEGFTVERSRLGSPDNGQEQLIGNIAVRLALSGVDLKDALQVKKTIEGAAFKYWG